MTEQALEKRPKLQRRDKVALLILLVLMAGICLLFVLPRFVIQSKLVIGPTPNEIRAMCTPITCWVVEEYERTGQFPNAPLPEHWDILNSLPYDCAYTMDKGGNYSRGGALIVVGSLDQWPHPLYNFRWTADLGLQKEPAELRTQWRWGSDYPVTEQEAEEILRKAGYDL